MAPLKREMPVWAAAAVIVALTCLAYLNSFGGDFVFDDIPEIASNPALDQLWPPWGPMFGGENPARPLPYLSFAVDRAIWGAAPFGYHLTNLAVHLVGALALFDLTRLTLLSPRLRDRFGWGAVSLALVIAGLWAVHPLQTQAVTYVYQRIESMAGMFCLLSLAAFARAMADAWSWKWLLASLATCAAAMACKENAVVLPVLLVLYDWFFAAEDTPAAWRLDVRRRGGFHAACFLTWSILAAVILVQARKYQEFGETKWSPLTYALTQPGVILHYLRLALLPVGQCFDHSGWPPVVRFEAGQLPAYLAIAAIAGLSIYGTARRQPWAWPSLVFLVTLAPTSSVMPVEALANEHRMYLPLAAVVATIILGVAALGPRLASMLAPRLQHESANRAASLGRVGLIAAGIATIALVTLTRARNTFYRSGTAIWVDVLDHDPDNYRALWQLAVKLDWLGNEPAAFEMADRALAGKPTCDVYTDLARAKLSAGDYEAAERRFRLGLERRRSLLPTDHRAVLSAIGDLATGLLLAGRLDEAAALSGTAVDDMRRILGNDDTVTLRAEQIIAEALSGRGDQAAAETLAASTLDQARRTRKTGDPLVVAGSMTLARVLDAGGKTAAAERTVTRVLDDLAGLGPRREAERLVLENLRAEILEKQGRCGEAMAIYAQLAEKYRTRLGPDHPETRAMIAKHALAGDRGKHEALQKP